MAWVVKIYPTFTISTSFFLSGILVSSCLPSNLLLPLLLPSPPHPPPLAFFCLSLSFVSRCFLSLSLSGRSLPLPSPATPLLPPALLLPSLFLHTLHSGRSPPTQKVSVSCWVSGFSYRISFTWLITLISHDHPLPLDLSRGHHHDHPGFTAIENCRPILTISVLFFSFPSKTKIDLGGFFFFLFPLLILFCFPSDFSHARTSHFRSFISHHSSKSPRLAHLGLHFFFFAGWKRSSWRSLTFF